MMRMSLGLMVVVGISLLPACGGGGGGTHAGPEARTNRDQGVAPDTGVTVDAKAPVADMSAPGKDAAKGDGASCTTLTVKNYLSWCSVSVAGMTASTSAKQTVCVPPGSVTLTAMAESGFKLGDWHHTSGDTGSGDPGTVSSGTSTATVVVGSSGTCVWVCCPFTCGGGCPAADQCP